MVFLFHTYGWDHVSCCFLHAACFPDAVLATSDMDTICSDKVPIHTTDKYHRWPHMISSLPSSWIFYTRNPLNGLQNCSLCCRCASVWIYSQVSPTLGLFVAFFQCCAAVVRVCESLSKNALPMDFAAPLHLCDRGDFGVLRFYCLAYDVSFLWILWWRVLTQRKGFFPGLQFTLVAWTLELCLYVPFLLVGLHFFPVQRLHMCAWWTLPAGKGMHGVPADAMCCVLGTGEGVGRYSLPPYIWDCAILLILIFLVIAL